MALFPDDRPGSRRPRRARRIGWTLLIAAVLGGFAFAGAPAPYVIEQPGPVFNTLGTVMDGGKRVLLIEIPDQKTYPTGGALDMLTVNLVGSRTQSPSWIEIVQAWLDPSKAVLPIDAVYPAGESVDESNKQSKIDMQNSQKDAVAAALRQLGYPLQTTIEVGGLSPKSPSAGILSKGDTIVSVNGRKPDSVVGLRSIIGKAGTGTPVEIVIRRGAAEQTVRVMPELSNGADPVPIIGILPSISYTFPFEVKIQLENVGGPSAGQMFALGIIDKLTPGQLTGGARVAGTGTIDAEGNIGAIGGIRQKMYGAKAAGATWFLAPSADCGEVTGHIPSGLRVFAVTTLDDSLAALKAISAGTGTGSLPSCPAK